jgi:hypothetical protein
VPGRDKVNLDEWRKYLKLVAPPFAKAGRVERIARGDDSSIRVAPQDRAADLARAEFGWSTQKAAASLPCWPRPIS